MWPDKRQEDKVQLDSWFAVAPVGSPAALPRPAPQELTADCLLTASLVSPLLPSRLFRRLAEPFMWPKVADLPANDCYYESKFEEVRFWRIPK